MNHGVEPIKFSNRALGFLHNYNVLLTLIRVTYTGLRTLSK